MTANESIEQICERYGPLIYRRALVLLGDPAEAQDALQDVLVRVIERRATFRGRAKLSTWLYSITTHDCLNRLRNRRHRAVLVAQNLIPPEALKPGTDNLLLVRSLLEEADEREAAAAIHVFVDGMPRDEAAAVMGVSVRTIGNLLDRFLGWARRKLDSDDRRLEGRKGVAS